MLVAMKECKEHKCFWSSRAEMTLYRLAGSFEYFIKQCREWEFDEEEILCGVETVLRELQGNNYRVRIRAKEEVCNVR